MGYLRPPVECIQPLLHKSTSQDDENDGPFLISTQLRQTLANAQSLEDCPLHLVLHEDDDDSGTCYTPTAPVSPLPQTAASVPRVNRSCPDKIRACRRPQTTAHAPAIEGEENVRRVVADAVVEPTPHHIAGTERRPAPTKGRENK